MVAYKAFLLHPTEFHPVLGLALSRACSNLHDRDTPDMGRFVISFLRSLLSVGGDISVITETNRILKESSRLLLQGGGEMGG